VGNEDGAFVADNDIFDDAGAVYQDGNLPSHVDGEVRQLPRQLQGDGLGGRDAAAVQAGQGMELARLEAIEVAVYVLDG
jgi:hypothetical protein